MATMPWEETNDRIQLCSAEPTEDTIRNLLDICESLNDRLRNLETRLRITNITATNGVQPD